MQKSIWLVALGAILGLASCDVEPDDDSGAGGDGGSLADGGSGATGGSGGDGGTGGDGGRGGDGGSHGELCEEPGRQNVALPGKATAAEILEASQMMANKALGGVAQWKGGIQGTVIGRDGKPFVFQGEAFELEGGWLLSFCHDMDEFGVTTGISEQFGECAFGGFDCSKIGAAEPFTLDSPEIISRAFPDAPEPVRYNLSLLYALSPKWEVTQISGEEVLKKYVDSLTGEVTDER